MIASALRGLGMPIGNVNNKGFEDEGFWHTIPVALDKGARRGAYRDSSMSFGLIYTKTSELSKFT